MTAAGSDHSPVIRRQRRALARPWQLVILLLGLLFALPAPLAAGDEPAATRFDAKLAWAAFTTLLREQYGYFERPGIDGNAILSAFAARAMAAPDDAAFIDVLQLVSHNFADPHFIVGPFDAGDWAVIPTASDLHGRVEDGVFRIEQVRADSAARAAGMVQGMVVQRIDGAPPRALVEAITGRAWAALSPAQVDFAFDIALAGRRSQPRTLIVADGAGQRRFVLAPTRDQARRLESGPLLDVERRGRLGIIRVNNSLGNAALLPAFAAALATLADTDDLLIDLRNTPSGGNTSVARGILGHFVTTEMPYQVHVIPYESRVLGPPRKFVEYVLPHGSRYAGKVHVAGGRWTGSMGEGLMIGFDAIGAATIGSDLGDLLGALSNERIAGSAARIDIGTEQLFTVAGQPRADFRPRHYLGDAERSAANDPAVAAILASVATTR